MISISKFFNNGINVLSNTVRKTNPITKKPKLIKTTIPEIKKELNQLEHYAKTHLGISVTYKPGLLITRPFQKRSEWIAHKNTASFINNVFMDLKSAGYDLPDVASNSTLFKLYEKVGVIKTNLKGAFSPDLNKNAVWFNPKEMHGFLKFTSSETVAHEVGHYLHFKQNPELFKNSKTMTKKEVDLFKIELQRILKGQELDSINNFVEYFSQNPQEFVAFYFQKAVHGQTFSDDITKMYQKYGGPEIKDKIKLQTPKIGILG